MTDQPTTDDLLFPLLQEARDEDSLDITDEEIRDGHHRIEPFASLARKAFDLGAKLAAEELNAHPLRYVRTDPDGQVVTGLVSDPDLLARLGAAELVCYIVAGRGVDSDREGRALTQAWIDWSRTAGRPEIPARSDEKFEAVVDELAARRDKARAATIAAMRDQFSPETVAFYANDGGPGALAAEILPALVHPADGTPAELSGEQDGTPA